MSRICLAVGASCALLAVTSTARAQVTGDFRATLRSVRIVAVADTHQFHDELTVPDGDLFVHAGDLCRGGSWKELRAAAEWIRGLPHRRKVIVAGNHDWAFARDRARAVEAFGDATYLQDEETRIDGLRVYGTPWQPEFHDWAFNLPRGEALAEKWSAIPTGLDVLITHGPPAGIGDRSSMGDARTGCVDLRARVAIVRPRVHLFGHIHEDGGAWEIDGTWFVNCTTWECERRATVIDVDEVTGAITVHAPAAR
jgi:Icc-related predicted phosphoesterase